MNYKKSGIAAEHFQTIAAGETVNASVNAATTHNLEGVATADITAIQGFQYTTGTTAPSALSGLEVCDDVTSNTVSITPDQKKVAA